jgi:mRNA interferase MazF
MPPRRGEIWWVAFDPTEGHEQAGRRPALVVSTDPFNPGPQELVVVAPITSTIRPLPLHVAFTPADCGPTSSIRRPGAIRCDQIRTVSFSRLLDSSPAGQIADHVLENVDLALRQLLELPVTP